MSEDLRKYFQEKTKKPCKDFDELIEFCNNVKYYTEDVEKDKWSKFFYSGSVLIERIAKEERLFNQNHLKDRSIEYLKEENLDLHYEKLPEFYGNSFANPQYAVKIFKNYIGNLNNLLYKYLLDLTGACQQNHLAQMEMTMKLFSDYFLLWFNGCQDHKKFFNLIKDYNYNHLLDKFRIDYTKRFDPDFEFYVNWVKTADLNDLRYLFYYGRYVSENEIQTAEFLNTLPQKKIDRVMHQTAKAYIMGFAESNKDYKTKKTVILYFRIGMERLARSLILELEQKYGLKVLIAGISSGKYDQQYQYDHRFSDAMYLDNKYKDFFLKQFETVNEEFKDLINDVSGAILFDPFGEKPFNPKNRVACLKYNEKQLELNKQIRSSRSLIYSKYYKRSETSFCIIGFPNPEIGENFKSIFDKTIDINMLDHDKWLKIQKFLIDALDQADHVYIKGQKKNKTEMIVKLQKLNNPKKESNFANCGATVNIPVGEVFNTPQLNGTNGILHLPRTFLNGFLYKHLKLEFINGRIVDYDCENYTTTQSNRKYIEENLLFPHKSLPISEFAIGTNTLAYAVAKKYKILSVLPILIIEKMGPHFAIGDTCYSREEDTPVFNPDGKEIISRDNEQSIIRKEDPLKAYLNVHTDITLPYDEIGLIQAVKSDGTKITIIKKGRFALKGTEELNQYLNVEI